MNEVNDTIAATATPPGYGGVAIVRVSGPHVTAIAKKILKKIPSPRQALHTSFFSHEEVIDEGIALFFPGPNSFTGEDVLELQGHGGPVVQDRLLKAVIHLGARIAQPGEFSQRAFLNGKMDLIQAEAIADLIESQSYQAAQAAVRSLQGQFSKQITLLLEELIRLRVYVEAAIDFPEEEVDFLAESHIQDNTKLLEQRVIEILKNSRQGALLREGVRIVLAGRPNAGKSTLLNALCGKDVAIVTSIPGTTRDVMREEILVDGIPIRIIDTAGLRQSDDEVEKIGVERATKEIENADHVLFLLDLEKIVGDDLEQELNTFTIDWQKIPSKTIVLNKLDLIKNKRDYHLPHEEEVIQLSAKTGDGLSRLRERFKKISQQKHSSEGIFLARQRHIVALEEAKSAISRGIQQIEEYKAGELLAEELRIAQDALSKITGAFTSDDLLGEIFSSFCIGK